MFDKKEYSKKWRENNPNYMKEWAKDNPEKILGYSRRYYKDNTKKCNERCRQNYENNHERELKRAKQYRKNNLKRIQKYQKQWRDNVQHIYRSIIEEKLGRKLKDGEQVHHIDMDNTNNKIENLYVYGNNGKHHRGHASLNKLVSILFERNIIKFKKGKYYLN